MKKIVLTTSLCLIGLISFSQTQKQPIKKAQPKKTIINNTVKADDVIIRTNNKDTLYLELDNAIILTPKKNAPKVEMEIKATQGEITKLTANFYQLGSLKEGTVTVTVFDKKTKQKLEEKKFVVTKQILPF